MAFTEAEEDRKLDGKHAIEEAMSESKQLFSDLKHMLNFHSPRTAA